MHHSILLAACWLHLASLTQALCYYGKGRVADSQIQNCSSTDGQLSICCKIGHNCLEQGVCKDPETGTEYLYGCTDPEYANRQCPYKWEVDLDASPWVGLTKNGCDTQKDVYMFVHPDTCGHNCPAAPWDPLSFTYPSNMPCADLSTHYWAYNLSLDAVLSSTGAAHAPVKPSPVPEIVTTLTQIQVVTTKQHISIVTTAAQTSVQTWFETQTITVAPSSNSNASSSTSPPAATLAPQKSNDNLPAIYGLGAAVGLVSAAAIALGISLICLRRRTKKRAAWESSTRDKPRVLGRMSPNKEGFYSKGQNRRDSGQLEGLGEDETRVQPPIQAHVHTPIVVEDTARPNVPSSRYTGTPGTPKSKTRSNIPDSPLFHEGQGPRIQPQQQQGPYLNVPGAGFGQGNMSGTSNAPVDRVDLSMQGQRNAR